MGSLTLALVISAAVSGWLNDRFSPRLMTILSAVVSAVGYVLISTARNRIQLIGYGAVLGIGMGVFLTTNWTLANLLAPSEEAGKYVGLTNIATAGSSALGGLMGPIIDRLNIVSPGNFYGYTFLFLVGGATALLSLAFLPGIKIPDDKKHAPA
jgi:MFS family permease